VDVRSLREERCVKYAVTGVGRSRFRADRRRRTRPVHAQLRATFYGRAGRVPVRLLSIADAAIMRA
jgi:hypothetical protein